MNVNNLTREQLLRIVFPNFLERDTYPPNIYLVSDEELTTYLSPSKVRKMKAFKELARRDAQELAAKNTKVNSSDSAYQYAKNAFLGLDHEEFYVLHLNRNNLIIDMQQVSKGGVSGTIVDMKIILSRAIVLKASAMILMHNHPSGSDRPSEADINITKKVKDGAKLLDITVLDHLIFAGNTYYSFADEGMM